jgi:hypothetical protein
MSSGGEAFTCPACLFRGMRAAMDRKGRPYFRCETCSMIMFVRLGPLGVHTVANVLRLLDRDAEAAWVRAEALKDVAAPGQGLRALLGVKETGGAPPAAVADGGERREAMGA